MSHTICLFEDPQFVKLLPLVYTRPVYELRCGILTLREKIQAAYPKASTSLLCRPYLAEVVKQQHPGTQVNEVHSGNCLLLNGRILADKSLAKKIPLKGPDAVYLSGNVVVAVRMNAGGRKAVHDLSEVLDADHFAELQRIDVNVELVEYPWQLVHKNGENIVADFGLLALKGTRKGKVYPGAQLLNKKQIAIEKGATIKPGVVLDAEKGPIYIGKNAKLLPNAVVVGPAFIGEGSIVKVGAKIYENTSIGEMCKVGGEIEGSIIHSFSNKQHDGFLGHAYLGVWCNLGADTNNSDLKNNYGSVKVQVNGSTIDTGLQFVGLIMGDHSKSGINTMFNTGTIVGVSCNVFGAGYPPKFLPSFIWGGSDGVETYDIEKGLDVERKVMLRRNVPMTAADEMLLRKVFSLTQNERKSIPHSPIEAIVS
ncbi:MAG: GlmU family protein [Ignavibacteriae bacterium]|nr:GlmU family protein [Ignavibacteriota bacterium]